MSLFLKRNKKGYLHQGCPFILSALKKGLSCPQVVAWNCKFWSSTLDVLCNLEINWYKLIICDAETVNPELIEAQIALIISQTLPSIRMYSRCQKCTYTDKFPLQFCWHWYFASGLCYTQNSNLCSAEQVAELQCWEKQFWSIKDR